MRLQPPEGFMQDLELELNNWQNLDRQKDMGKAEYAWHIEEKRKSVGSSCRGGAKDKVGESV